MTDRPASPPRRRRACAPCTKAKARCKFNQQDPDQHICERCERLNIECAVQISKSMRKARQIRPTNQGGVAGLSASSRPKNTDEVQRQSMSDVQNSVTIEILEKEIEDFTGSQELFDQSDLANVSLPLGLSREQATRILAIFKTRYMAFFPFIVIEDGKDIHELHDERPFLLCAMILVAAPFPVSRIVRMKRAVLAYLSHQIFDEEKKTLDLLQGILVCVAWSHTCQISDEQVTNLMHLALGYAHNLGITRTPKVLDLNNSKYDLNATGIDVGEKRHSLDEQRTLLGCFCILSIISDQASRRNPMNEVYSKICQATLSAASTSPPDLLIDRLVRMVHIGETLIKELGEPHERDQALSYAFLLEGSGKRFRTELDRLAEINAHPDLIEHQSIFKLYHYYLIVRLYEPAITVAYRPEDGVPPSRYRSLCLGKCLTAAKSFLELLLAQPTDSSLYRSIITAGQASFVMLMAARLLLIDSLDWDVARARQELDLCSFLDKIFTRVTETEALRLNSMEEFSLITGMTITEEERQEGSKLVETARRTRWLREWFVARIKKQQMDASGSYGDECDEVMNSDGDEAAPSWWIGLLGNVEWHFESLNAW